MLRRKGRRNRLAFWERRRSQVIIAIVTGLSFVGLWTMLAYSGALDSMFRQMGKRGGTVSPESFNSNSPSKEYIYAGGKLVATEEPTASSGCSLTSAPTWNSVSTSLSGVTLTWTVPTG